MVDKFYVWFFSFSGCEFLPRRASREHKAAPWKKLLGVLSDKAQTLQYDRTFHSKQSHDFCFSILTVFGGKMTSQC